MKKLLSFHGKQSIKDKYIKRVEAHQKADLIVKEAKDSLSKMYREISELRKSKMQFEANLKAMAQAHLSLLDQGETFMPKMRLPYLDLE